jgi:hypothetical protein
MRLVHSLFLRWHALGTARAIRRNGFRIIYVGDYESAPTWAYTVGFDETLNHPEIVLFDVPKASAARILSHVFDEIRAGRMVVEDGADVEGTAQRCVWRKVHPDRIDQWLTLACFRRRLRTGLDDGLEAYQFVLSDPAGVLPWEAGYDEQLRALQPALWKPEDV